MTSDKAPLSARAKQILKSLIDLYIQDGQPVPSKVLVQLPGVACSSATIRNVMAELEEAGYITAPHTSAGRIPTQQGYRFFVDSLLTTQPMDATLARQVQQSIANKTSQQALANSVSDLLSGLTRLAGVVTLPRQNRVTLKQVEFLPLSEMRILVILVLNHHEIQNRIVSAERAYSRSELEQAGNYLTQKFAGRTLLEARQALLSAMQADKAEIDQIMYMMLDVAEKTFTLDPDNPEYVMAGHGNLLGLVDDQGVDNLQKLFQAFNEKRDILQLFDQSLQAEGVQIFIGEESGFANLGACSLITAPYQVEQQPVGVIGVIGPTRMAYDRVIPIVDMTARLVSLALDQER